eukprot:TRINITY_DN5367_c0_g1_i2.p1 TRINITY_DN5367_c0_g1~~TRINITY_DN5367_c0_g1_i2.p1  ORF type:complete len:103 (+),score=4.81 TRINITY_DN5367_c0_g1_i2:194-502(+)
MVILGGMYFSMTEFASVKNRVLIFSFVMALVSRNFIFSDSANFLAELLRTLLFPSKSILFPTKVIETESLHRVLTCCNQLCTFLKVISRVMSYTMITASARE